MSSNYELSEKDNVVDLAIQKNSLKFLNHLWNVQNSYVNVSRKNQKNFNSMKEHKTNLLFKRKSLLFFSEGETNSSIPKIGIKLIDLIKLLYKLKEHRYYKSIRYANFVLIKEK